MGFSTLTIHTEQKKQRGEGFGANARRTGERQKGDLR